MNRRSLLTGAVGMVVAWAAERNKLLESAQSRVFAVQFEDVAKLAGLASPTVFGGQGRNRFILETTGCGAAFFDYDNDGWQDIFLVNGQTLETRETGALPSRLLRNNRDGTFTDVTQKAGLTKTGWGQGVCIGDYDNDGFDDLFVTYWGHNVLYHNNGDGTFSDVTQAAGLYSERIRWGSGCAFIDYDRDGLLDLFVTNYVDLDLKSAPKPGSSGCTYQGLPVNCGPRGLPKTKSLLFRNNGNGTFTDVTASCGIANARASYGLGVLVADLNNDSFPDVYVSNDTEPSHLFWNKGGTQFLEGGMAAGVATSEDGRNQAGMGIASGDYDCDGFLDIFKTNFSDDLPNLYRNTGHGFFEEVNMAMGLGLHSRYLGWGCGFVDADNDGWPDILYVNGHVYPEIDQLKPAVGYKQPMILYRSLGGRKFEDVSSLAGSAFRDHLAARGCAFGDFDNDGSVDVLVNPINDVPRLLKCTSIARNNWITLKLIGKKSNRSAIGARVRCVTGSHQQIDEVRSGGSFMSQNDLRIHFGLGEAKRIDQLEIQWPSGQLDRFKDLMPNKFLTIEEGQSSGAK
jgi:enediyne biosynthesis protein E4